MKFSNRLYLLRQNFKKKRFEARINKDFNKISNSPSPSDRLMIGILDYYFYFRKNVINSHKEAIMSIIENRYKDSKSDHEFFYKYVFELTTPDDLYRINNSLDYTQLRKLLHIIIEDELIIPLIKSYEENGINIDISIFSTVTDKFWSNKKFETLFIYYSIKYFPPVDILKVLNMKIFKKIFESLNSGIMILGGILVFLLIFIVTNWDESDSFTFKYFFDKIPQKEKKSKEFTKLFIEGQNFFKKADYSNAIECYNKAISLEPDSCIIYRHLGLSHYQIGDYNSSKNYLIKYLSNYKNDEFSLAYLGLTYLYLKQYDSTVTILEKSNKIKSNVRANFGLGLFYTMRNTDSALYYYNKCLDFDTTKAPKDIWCLIYLGIGSCYIRNLEYDKSFWYFNKSLQHMETGEGYFCLATYYLFKGNTEETIRYLKKSSDMGYQLAMEKLKSDYNIEY